MDPLISESTAFWHKFRAAFADALMSQEKEIIIDAWTYKHSSRTLLYKKILPDVAASLGLEYYPKEHLRVDHVLLDRKSNVPLVFIESENDATTATQEIWKLCSVSAPLKVLLTVAEWDDTEGVWPLGSRREQLLGEWKAKASEQHRVWPSPGLLVAIIGERCKQCRDRLRFYSYSFATQTGMWHDDGLMIERYLA